MRNAIVALTAALLCPAPALGEGEGTTIGGGGDWVHDGRELREAGPWIERRVGERVELDHFPGLRAELERAGRILARYGADVIRRVFPAAAPDAPLAKFLVEQVLSSRVEYRLVEGEPGCDRSHLVDLPRGMSSGPLGCTRGDLSALSKAVFPAMSPREQAKAVIHTRLHAVAGSGYEVHESIADLTEGLGFAVAVELEQESGNWRLLDAEETRKLDAMRRAIVALGLRTGTPADLAEYLSRRVTSRGGGVVKFPLTEGFVGIGSHLYGSLGRDSRLVRSSCDFPPECATCAKNENPDRPELYAGGCRIGQGSELTDSVIHGYAGQMRIGNHARLRDVWIGRSERMATITPERGRPYRRGYLKHSVYTRLDDGAALERVRLDGFEVIHLAAGARMEDVRANWLLDYETYWGVEYGYGRTIGRIELGERSALARLAVRRFYPWGPNPVEYYPVRLAGEWDRELWRGGINGTLSVARDERVDWGYSEPCEDAGEIPYLSGRTRAASLSDRCDDREITTFFGWLTGLRGERFVLDR